MQFFTFGWYFPFSMPFLSSQTSLFAPNFRNQVRKPDFGRTLPVRLTTLQKTEKNQKTVLPDTFFQSDSFQHTNLLQNTFWPSLETFHYQKVWFRSNFPFFTLTPIHRDFFFKKSFCCLNELRYLVRWLFLQQNNNFLSYGSIKNIGQKSVLQILEIWLNVPHKQLSNKIKYILNVAILSPSSKWKIPDLSV